MLIIANLELRPQLKPFFISLFLVILSSTYSYAESPFKNRETHKKIELIITKASKGRAGLVSYFYGPGNLIGVIFKGTSPGAKKQTIGWVLPEKNLFFWGNLLDSEGKDLSEIAAKIYLTPPLNNNVIEKQPPLQKEIFLKQTKGFSLFKNKNKEKTIYVISIPGCPDCFQMNSLLTGMETFFIKNKIEVKWIAISPQQQTLAEAININKNGVSAALIKPITGLKDSEITEIKNSTDFIIKNYIDENKTTISVPILIMFNKQKEFIKKGILNKSEIKEFIKNNLNNYS